MHFLTSIGFVLLLLGTQIHAATHVNISIAQHAIASSDEDVAYANSQSAEDFQSGSAKLRLADENSMRSARVQAAPPLSGRTINFAYGQQQQQQQLQRSFNSQPHSQQQQKFSRLRKAQAQKKQNQEFERYIQNYHSGPTVETVFESSSPAPARYQNSASSSSASASSSVSASSNAAPQRIVAIGSRPASHQMHFERQVALPVSQARQDYTQNTQAQTKPITEKVQENSVPSAPAASSVSPSSGSSTSHSIPGQDQFNFDNSYSNNHNFDQGNYNFDDQSDLTHEYPPSFDESQTGYFDSADEDSSAHLPNHQGYLPPQQPSYHHQRPVVTKTIQIAQPALKAKKYEVRHPAIQKEFYDIEERVVIKPAGTIVVELERPVAKIPKGEAILPLGIPHPAVAGAYNNNGLSVAQTQSNTVPAQFSSNNQHQTQYNSAPVYNVKSTVASAVTTMPVYDQNQQSDFVDAKLRKTYNNADAQQSSISTTERTYVKEQPAETQQKNDDFFLTDGQGNQRQISSKNLTPKMFVPQSRDDVDTPTYRQHTARVEVKNNGEPNAFNAYNNANLQNNYNNVGNQYQTAQYNDNNNDKFAKSDDYFDAEYVDQDNRQPQDSKPARLQEQPVKNFESEPQKPLVTTHIIKHEHNIHLPPSQHNIYLGRMHQEQKPHMQSGSSRYEDEAARVLEIKPNNHAQRHRAPVFVYAASTSRPLNIRHNKNFNDLNNNNAPKTGQYRLQSQNNNVQYSAPYSQMRYNPRESERYVQESPVRSANLKQEDNLSKEQSQPHTHIQIQIPQHPEESHKPIFVSSTIAPMTSQSQSQKTSAKYRLPSDARSSSFNGEVETFNSARGFSRQGYAGQQDYGQLKADQPDCDHSQRRQSHAHHQETFSRIIELPGNIATTATPSTASGSNTGALSTSITSSSSSSSSSSLPSSAGSSIPSSSSGSAAEPSMATTNVGELGSEHTMPMGGVDINLKSNHGQINTGGSRVIAATPAPKDASASSESFHKRRIVVNHPFQTVREVVEHEPITNYHHVQVNEPALSPYYQMHDSLRQYEDAQLVYPGHGNFQYAYQQHI